MDQSNHHLEAEPEQLLDSLADRYLLELQTGQSPDRQSLLATHPDLAEKLDRRLAVIEALHGLTRERSPAGDTAKSSSAQSKEDVVSRAVRLLEPPGEDGEIGRLGRYRVLSVLGSGAMGCVFKALHPVMDRVVAVKVISPRLVGDAAAVERFHREVKAVSRLQHPNIVTAFDADQVGSAHFLVMEFVDGTDLTRLLAEHGRLPAATAADIIRQAALGLEHAHEHGTVHRDLKPSNLMVNRQGLVKVLDLGLARIVDHVGLAAEANSADRAMSVSADSHGAADEPTTWIRIWSEAGEQSLLLSGADSSATQTHTVLGTPDYMAPEQARDPRSVDARTDVYSLGATLYHLLSGQVPFPAGTILEKITLRENSDPRLLVELAPDIDHRLAQVVARMTTRCPEGRFQSAAEVVEALQPFAAAATSRTLNQSSPANAARQMRPWRWGAIAAALIALPLLSYWLIGSHSHHAAPSTSGTAARSLNEPIAADSALREIASIADAPDFTNVRPFFEDEFDDPSVSRYLHVVNNDEMEMNFEDGRYFFQSKDILLPKKQPIMRAEHLPGQFSNFACEIVARVQGTAADAFVVVVTNQQNLNRSVQISLSADGMLHVGTAYWDPEPDRAPTLGPITCPPGTPAGEFTRLLIAIHGRTLHLFVNSVAVIDPIDLGRDVTPGVVAVGLNTLNGHCRVDLERVRAWRLEESSAN